ncbi:unnamed protein product [Rotaria sp. Silwood2]|nr:unnamed protein product [Rotaria sp. Silwood2]CAF2506027.1 unnamed protein product [Rotaria sp. Silwood2]CAF3996199.1 unnamed protein product [Rotaria sp. Silwood2]CAF4169721.1 unnamed protein product [Rotaria sp. Silwood2]CAF4172640.1 unnamed protein product [Rotaria sp. Silwood2]
MKQSNEINQQIILKSFFKIPIKIDPSISNIAVRIHTCFNINTLLSTLVPNELATSFAPIPNANIDATKKSKINTYNRLIEHSSKATQSDKNFEKRV